MTDLTDTLDSYLPRRKRRLRGLRIKCVSIVDDPANQHARIGIFKRAQPDEDEDEKPDLLWPPKLTRAWNEIRSASRMKFPEMTPDKAWVAYRESAEGRRARRDFEDLRERIHGVRFDGPPKEPAVKMSPAPGSVHVDAVPQQQEDMVDMKPIAVAALPEGLRPRWSEMLRRARLYDGLTAYLASDEGKAAFRNFASDYERITGEALPGVPYDEQEPVSPRYNAFDPAFGIGGPKADGLAKRFRERPEAYADHIMTTTRDPYGLINAVNEAVLDAIEPIAKLLREDGLTRSAALDRALSLTPGAYSWSAQRIREIQAAPHETTEKSLTGGFAALNKRVTVLADAAKSLVRKGAATSNEAALRDVLDGGGLGDDAA